MYVNLKLTEEAMEKFRELKPGLPFNKAAAMALEYAMENVEFVKSLAITARQIETEKALAAQEKAREYQRQRREKEKSNETF